MVSTELPLPSYPSSLFALMHESARAKGVSSCTFEVDDGEVPFPPASASVSRQLAQHVH
jgi:hypothetical protein